MFTEAQEATYKAGLVRFRQSNNKTTGAGFYINNGYIVTCAHVVAQSLNPGSKRQITLVEEVANKPVKLDFPFVAKEQFQYAEIVPELWRFNDQDLAVLKVSEVIPIRVNSLPFKDSNYYRTNHYHIYGFPEGHPEGIWARGEFLGELTRGWIQMEDTKAQGLAVEPGFSGAPVWDETLQAIAGMTVARDKDREEAKVGFMIPYQKLKPALEAIALFDLLLPEADNLASHWQNAYRFVRPDFSTEPYPITLQEAILQIQNIADQGSGYRAIEQFIGYLSSPKLGLDVQPRLMQWLQDQNKDIDISALLQVIKQNLAEQQAKQSVAATPHLLFWVQAELNSDRYSVQAYLVRDRDQYEPLRSTQLTAPAAFLEKSDDGKVDQSEIEKILRACLYESSQAIGDIRKLRLEIFLPLHHLDWAVDRWATTDDPEPDLIGCRYQVVVRMSHRWQKEYSQYQGDWDDKWNMVNKFSHRPAYRGFICGDDQRFKTVRQHLRHANVIGLVLVQCPTNWVEGTSNPLLALLYAGSPIALWSRQSMDSYPQQFQQSLAGCQSKFEDLIATTPNDADTEETDNQNLCDGLLSCSLSHLPETVRKWREQADQECDDGESHVGFHVGFIWEDPRLVPPGAVAASRFRMSA